MRTIAGYETTQRLEDGPFGEVLAGRDRFGSGVVLHVLSRWSSEKTRDLRLLSQRIVELRKILPASSAVPRHIGVLEDQTPFLVTSQPPGRSLIQLVEARLSIDEVLQILRGVTTALAEALTRGAVHLALSPSCVVVARSQGQSDVTLLGAGLSMLLEAQRAQHWPTELRGFAAPEQRDVKAAITARADVYGVAALAIYMLRGRPLLAEPIGDAAATLAQRSDLPAPLRDLLLQMLEVGPEARPEMSAVARVVDKLCHKLATPAAGVTQPSAAVDAADPLIGQTVGNFRVLRRIGEGGMGIVYECRHTQIGRRAAVKVLHQELAQSEEYAARFINEARAVNIVQHPGLVEIFESGRLEKGSLYFVMEYLEGSSISERNLRRNGQPAPLSEVTEIALQIARALAAAHSHGIIHRDLKPENIMQVSSRELPFGERIKILDFGIAKFQRSSWAAQGNSDFESEPIAKTQIGQVFGTPLYMSLEQFRGVGVTDKSDVFSLGVILYELLAGTLPYPESPAGSLTLLGKPAPPLGKRNKKVPARIATLVHRMLSVESGLRPTMVEVAEEFERLQKARAAQRLRIAAVVGAVLMLGVVGLAYSVAQFLRPRTISALQEPALRVLRQNLRSSDPSLRQFTLQALGRSRDVKQRALIEPLLHDQSPAVAAGAAIALGEIGAVASYGELQSLDTPSASGEVVLAAAEALSLLRHPRGNELLRKVLSGPDRGLQVLAAIRLLAHGDFSGAALVRDRVVRSATTEPAIIQALGLLAGAGDAAARQRLIEQLNTPAARGAQGYIAFTLARLGDTQARAQLMKLADTSGAEQLLAARFLASLGEPCDTRRFVKPALSPQSAEATRVIALEGLAECGSEEAALAVAPLLSDSDSSERVRIATAGAVLQILANTRAELAEHSLDWARAALSSDSVAARQLAVAMLSESDSEGALDPLTDALKDSDAEVRRSAANALGRKRGRKVLPAMLLALADRDDRVRLAGMESVRLFVQKVSGDADADGIARLKKRLQELLAASREIERVVASGALFLLGDQGQQAALRNAALAKDPRVRQVALEIGPVDNQLLQAALHDADHGVRMSAARRLSQSGSPAGVAVLREIAASDEVDSLEAYQLLRKMKQDVPLPTGLTSKFTVGELKVKLQVLSTLQDFPEETRAQILSLASIDPSPVVRRRVVKEAAELYRQTPEVAYLHVVRALAHDSDVSVRAAAVEASATLPAQKKEAASADQAAPQKSGSDSAAKPTAEPENSARIRFVGEELVPVRIDGGPPVLISDKPVSVRAGRHQITYLGGNQNIDALSGKTITVQIPVSLAGQYLFEIKSALQTKEYDRVQQLLNRIRAMGDRGRVPAAVRGEAHFYQGRLYEARSRPEQALIEYDLFIAASGAAKKGELVVAAQKSLSRLGANQGRLQIYTQVDGQCRLSSEQLKPPGEHLISIGGATRRVWAQSGVVSKVSFCP